MSLSDREYRDHESAVTNQRELFGSRLFQTRPVLSKDLSLRFESNSKSLSEREGTVLYWLAEGKTAGEIGVILGISEYTVRAHIRSIIQKLNASNVANAVARAFMLGIFDT